jgi:myo-inositol-1(or 4)-monophosphatase
MHGRRLATLDEIIGLAAPDSDDIVDIVKSWAKSNDIGVTVLDVGTDITNGHIEREKTTLGISIGGDGTFLEAARSLAPFQIPLMGVNSGTLAFLARVEPMDVKDALTAVYRGRASVNARQQYEVTAGDIETTGINEMFLQKHPPEDRYGTKVGSLHVFVDEEYVGEYFGSGLIISTPTGSTGRAYSNHGPVHYPQNNRTLQIIPHETISAAVDPIVVSQDSEIDIVLDADFDIDIDGGRQFERLEADTVVRITGANQPVQTVRTEYDDAFITALVDKLDWGLRTVDNNGPQSALESRPASSNFEERAARVAREAARSAGEPLRELHGQVENVEYKTDKSDIVTEADYQANYIIQTAINSEFPEHVVQSEENDQIVPEDGYGWIVDPLDGTGNFAHGNPNYSISIALLKDRKPVLGVVYAPESEEMFYAIDGEGAYQNGHEIQPTSRDRLDESMLLSGYDPNGEFLQAFYHETQGVRRLGSAALNLAYVAAGSADAVWEHDTHPWDVAAGLCILQEVGGEATDQYGSSYELSFNATNQRTPLLASNGSVHQPLVSHIERASSMNE